MLGKLWIALSLATIVAAFGASTALATGGDIVRTRPAGEITARSLGKITLNTQIFEVSCNMTLRGRLVEEARGELVGELAQHPQIGQITGGSLANCTTFSTVRLLFETFTEWLIYVQGLPSERVAGLSLLHMQYLISVPMLFACLFDVLLLMEYDGELLNIKGIASLQVRRLEEIIRASCPIPPVVLGRFEFAPDQRFTLERII